MNNKLKKILNKGYDLYTDREGVYKGLEWRDTLEDQLREYFKSESITMKPDKKLLSKRKYTNGHE